MKRIFIFLMVSFPVFLKAATISISGGSGGGGSGTITSVNAGSGLTGGGSSGAVTLTVDSTAVDLLASTQTITAQKTFTNILTIPNQINAISSDTIANVSGSSVTFNLGSTDWHYVQLTTNTPAGLLISNPSVGQQFTIILQQPGGGVGTTVNWFAGIAWPSTSIPTLSSGSGARDTFTFKTLSSGVYLGYVVGQNQ